MTLSPEEMVEASVREHIWEAVIVEPWTRERVIAVMQQQNRKTKVTREVWRALDLDPPVSVIVDVFGSWHTAVRAAGVHRSHRKRINSYLRGERLPVQPFRDWLNERLAYLYTRDDLKLDEYHHLVPAARHLARRLGTTPRTLQRYANGGVGGKDPTSAYRGPIERMLDHAGVSIYEIYPELEPLDDIPLEPDAFCPRCDETVTPVQGICPWCETLVRLPGEDSV